MPNAQGSCELQCVECPDPNSIYNDYTKKCDCISGMTMDPKTKLCGCPANESYSCGNPFCETTCNAKPKLCAMSNNYCVNKCYCNQGFMRINTNGRCVDKCSKLSKTLTEEQSE